MDMWQGVTGGLDARCTGCCWAFSRGVYQVKFRDTACVVHGGDLSSCQRRLDGTLSLASMLAQPSGNVRRTRARA